MATYGLPGIRVFVTLPTATNGTNSQGFVVPEGASVMVIHVPALVGTGATLKLQTLVPQNNDSITEAWTDITVFDLTDGTFEALDGMVEGTVVTIPVSATGPGPLRFVASEAQTGAADAITVKIVFGITH